MSGTITVRELIVELLDEDMDDLVFMGVVADYSEYHEIEFFGYSEAGERPRGVYLFRRKRDEL